MRGLVFMGGPMSVNDDLPWIAERVRLIARGGVADGVPVLGHCLGGQLMSKALGGTVSRNPVKEIGWGQVTVSPGAEARRWFGEIDEFLAVSLARRDLRHPAGRGRASRPAPTARTRPSRWGRTWACSATSK